MYLHKIRLTATLLALAGSVATASVQNGKLDIETTTRWVNNTNLEISATKHTVGSYTILLQFTELQNTRQPATFRTVMRGNAQKLLTVQPIQPEQPVRCAYRYHYIRGYHAPKLDSTFVYRLPYSTSRRPVQACTLYNLDERYFDGKPARGWNPWQFLLDEGDTVFAMRKGIVVEVHDGEAPIQAGLQATFRSKANFILVEHPDGTLCRYSVLDNGSITVEEGDLVFPGTPIGRAGTYYEGGERQVRIAVYFPDEIPDARKGNVTGEAPSLFEWVYYNPWFATSEGTVQLTSRSFFGAVSSPELVRKEMTKKELKTNLTL